jgi:hypothetical protein
MSLEATSPISIVYEAMEKIFTFCKIFLRQNLEKSNKQAVNVCGIFIKKGLSFFG